jgi:F1F0 ATPase subunit 2
MIEIITWLLAAFGGLVLGLFYFAGLWFTLQRVSGHPHPALWVAGGFLLRLAVSLSGFYLILGPDRSLIRLGIALLAFLVVRVVLTRRLRPTPEPR